MSRIIKIEINKIINIKFLKLLKKILFIPRTLIKFLVDTKNELASVQWYSGNKVIVNTIFIIAFLLIMSLSLLLIDKVLLIIRGLVIAS